MDELVELVLEYSVGRADNIHRIHTGQVGREEDRAQMVECLPGIQEALGWPQLYIETVVVAHIHHPSTQDIEQQQNQKFNVILIYVENLQPSWPFPQRGITDKSLSPNL